MQHTLLFCLVTASTGSTTEHRNYMTQMTHYGL